MLFKRLESDLTDEQLMLRFVKKECENSIHILLSRYYVGALAIAKGKLFCQTLAEDAVQTTFLKIIQKRHQFKQNCKFSSWFFTILKNVCIDMIRKIEREKQKIVNFTEIYPKKIKLSEYSLQELLAILPNKKDQEIIILHYIQGLNYAEIAEICEENLETIKKRSQRALKKIRKKLSLFADNKRIRE